MGESQGQLLLSMGAMVCNKVIKAPCLNLIWWGAQHADFKIFASVTCVLNFHNQKFPTSVCHVIPYGEVTKQTDRERNVPSVLYDSKFGIVICSSSDIYVHTIQIILTQFQHQVINKWCHWADFEHYHQPTNNCIHTDT